MATADHFLSYFWSTIGPYLTIADFVANLDRTLGDAINLLQQEPVLAIMRREDYSNRNCSCKWNCIYLLL